MSAHQKCIWHIQLTLSVVDYKMLLYEQNVKDLLLVLLASSLGRCGRCATSLLLICLYLLLAQLRRALGGP